MVLELQPQKLRIRLVLKSFFFPLTSPEVFDSFKARGFDVGSPPAPYPTGLRSYISGLVARKRNVLIEIDHNRKLVAVNGKSIEETLQTFSDMTDLITEDFYVNWDEELDFVELIAHYLIKSERNPFQVIQDSTELTVGNKLQEILGSDISQSRLSLVQKGSSPSSRSWFEINISPKLTMPTKAYWVEVIFRDENDTAVTNFASNINSTITNIINAIESD